jgi:hypothetical protein
MSSATSSRLATEASTRFSTVLLQKKKSKEPEMNLAADRSKKSWLTFKNERELEGHLET